MIIITFFQVELKDKLLFFTAKVINTSVCFKSIDGEIIIESTDPVFIEQVGSYPLEELREKYSVEKVTDSENRLFGYFVHCVSTDSEKLNLLEAAKVSMKIYCCLKRAEIMGHQNSESDILQRFLNRKLRLEKVIEEFGRHFPLERGSMIAVIGYKNISDKNSAESKELYAIEEKFRRFFKNFASWRENRKIVLGITPKFPMDERAASAFIISTLENIRERRENNIYGNIRVGFGTLKEELDDLPKSYEEAEMAFKVACLMKDGSWHKSWRQLGAMRLIMLFADHSETQNFVDNMLGRLINNLTHKENSELFDTLINIEKNSWNLKQTSLEMSYHYNTIKYRYQRIQEILETDLALPENRFNISLALKLYLLR